MLFSKVVQIVGPLGPRQLPRVQSRRIDATAAAKRAASCELSGFAQKSGVFAVYAVAKLTFSSCSLAFLSSGVFRSLCGTTDGIW